MPTITRTSPATISEQPDGLQPWSNIANAKIDDGVYATVGLSAAASASNSLVATGFAGDAVPDGATIDEIRFTVQARGPGGMSAVKDARATLWSAGAEVGASKATGANFASTDEDRTYAFSGADIAALTPALVNDAGFGCLFRLGYGSGLGTVTGSLDAFVRMEIDYTPAPPVDGAGISMMTGRRRQRRR